MEKTPTANPCPSDDSTRDISAAASQANNSSKGLVEEKTVNLMMSISTDRNKSSTIQSERGASSSDGHDGHDEFNLGRSQVELNVVVNPRHVGPPFRVNENGPDERDGSPPAYRTFSCCYCERVFSTPQGLSGHQNAHRRRGQYFGTTMDVSRHPYQHSRYPYHGSSIFNVQSPLGVRADSTIRKPSFGWSPHAYNRLNHGGRSSSSSSSSPAMALNWVRTMDGRYQVNTSRVGTLAGPPPTSAAAPAATTTGPSRLSINGSSIATTEGGDQVLRREEPPEMEDTESEELDLTLKL